MARFIPERPLYRKERLWVGFPLLAVFALLFLYRMLEHYLPLFAGNLWIGMLAVPAALLLPALIFFFVRGQGYSRRVRFKGMHGLHVPLLLTALPALLSGSLLLSVLCGGIDKMGNTVLPYAELSFTDPIQVILFTVTMAILPALLEEFVFRGIAMAEYERRGAVRAVVMSALLFSLAHFDLRNLLSHLFVGVLMALLLFATDTLLAPILVHASYQVLLLFCHRYISALYRFTGGMELFLFVLIVVLLASLALFFRFAAMLYRRREQRGSPAPVRQVPWNVQFYTILDALIDPPAVLCTVIAIFGFIFL